MTIFEALREDHKTQRLLADRLLETSGESEERRLLFERLKEEMTAHAKAEERCLYLPMLAVDVTQLHARHSIAEHHEMDEFLEELADTEMSSPHWLAVFKKLREHLFHHLDEEEYEIFQIAGKALSAPYKKQLGDEYRMMVKTTRRAAA